MTRRCLLFMLVVWSAGCLWRSYAAIMSVHLDVLTQTAAKLCAVVEAGRGPRAEQMAEYIYPSKRARAFLRQYRSYSQRRSYERFSTLVDRYVGLVREVDVARVTPGTLPAALSRLTAERDALNRLAADIRADLESGR